MNSNNPILSFCKIVSAILAWFLFSPLFFYFSKKWWPQQKVFRRSFLIISPLSFLFLSVLMIGGYLGYSHYERISFYNEKNLDKITNAPIPPFRVIERSRGNRAFVGDYKDYKRIQFKKDLTPEFYAHLDSLSRLNESYWSMKANDRDTVYSFNRMWGNGMPVPEGIPDFDGFLNFEIRKGVNEVNLEYGEW